MKTIDIADKNTFVELTRLEAEALWEMVRAAHEMNHAAAKGSPARRATGKVGGALLEFEEWRENPPQWPEPKQEMNHENTSAV